jgi:hypothetical protein
VGKVGARLKLRLMGTELYSHLVRLWKLFNNSGARNTMAYAGFGPRIALLPCGQKSMELAGAGYNDTVWQQQKDTPEGRRISRWHK